MTYISHLNSDTPRKTIGPVAARLVSTLYERSHPIFRLAEACEILGGELKTVQQLVFDLVERGVATRLKHGLYQLVPFELGFERQYLGNPYVVARELFLARRKQTLSASAKDYYLSHASAFDLHQILTQPQLTVYHTALNSAAYGSWDGF
jgi:predicted transcriptional regulator of viral defense system